MGRYNIFNEVASFTIKDSRKVSREGDLELGHLSAGLFGVSAQSLRQYHRLKTRLLGISGLTLIVYPSHLSSVCLDKKSQHDERAIKRVLNDISRCIKEENEEDKDIYYQLSHSIERFTKVCLLEVDSLEKNVNTSVNVIRSGRLN